MEVNLEVEQKYHLFLVVEEEGILVQQVEEGKVDNFTNSRARYHMRGMFAIDAENQDIISMIVLLMMIRIMMLEDLGVFQLKIGEIRLRSTQKCL